MLDDIRKSIGSALRRFNWVTGSDNPTLVKHGFWGILPQIVSSFVSLGLTIVYANFISKETLGTFKFIQSVAGSLTFLTLTGMNTAITQAVSRNVSGALPFSVKIQLKWSLLYIAGSVLVAGYYLFHHNAVIASGVLIVAIAFALTSSFNSYGAYLAGIQKFRRVSLFAIVSNMLYAGAITATLLLTHSLFALIAAHALGSMVPTAAAYFMTARHDRFEVPANEKKEITRYGKHLSFINILTAVSKNIDRILLFHYAGPVALASYSIAKAIPERAKGLLASAFPSMLTSLSKRSPEIIRSTFKKRMLQGILLGAAAFMVYWFTAPILIRFAAPKYLESIAYSRWLGVSLIFVVPIYYLVMLFSGQKMTRSLYMQTWVNHTLRIISIPFAVKFFGIWGLVISAIALDAFLMVWSLILWSFESRKLPSVNENLQ